MCVCVYFVWGVDIYVQVYMHWYCVIIHERQKTSSGKFLQMQSMFVYLVVLKQSILLAWSSPCSIGWIVITPQGSTWFLLLSARNTIMFYHAQIFQCRLWSLNLYPQASKANTSLKVPSPSYCGLLCRNIVTRTV